MISPITTYKIESESEADDYLKDLLSKKEYKSIDEVELRAKKLIDDDNLRNYFINKAKVLLKDL